MNELHIIHFLRFLAHLEIRRQRLTIEQCQVPNGKIEVFLFSRFGGQIEQHILNALVEIHRVLDSTFGSDAGRIEDGNALCQNWLAVLEVTARQRVLMLPLVD